MRIERQYGSDLGESMFRLLKPLLPAGQSDLVRGMDKNGIKQSK